ncbi:MAG: hypothetical protein ACOX1P_08570 [Thermoguttaceae bacterium]
MLATAAPQTPLSGSTATIENVAEMGGETQFDDSAGWPAPIAAATSKLLRNAMAVSSC